MLQSPQAKILDHAARAMAGTYVLLIIKGSYETRRYVFLIS
jgi:hypothetical protein